VDGLGAGEVIGPQPAWTRRARVVGDNPGRPIPLDAPAAGAMMVVSSSFPPASWVGACYFTILSSLERQSN